MGLKVRENKITHFFLIKITKMYNDKFFEIFLGLWISYTLTNKQKYISKQTYYKNWKNKTIIKY
jgi:hypothetical protein